MASLSKWMAKLAGRFGTCSRCMRQAFAAACGGILVALATTMLLSGWFVLAAWLAAAALMSLWVGHVWMFTWRSVRATALRASAGTRAAQQAALWPRRRVLAAFLRTLIFSAAAAMVPRTALAQECNCFTEDDCSCPPDFPNCVYNPTTGEAICCGPNATGCAGPQQTWCCPPGTNCYGNDGQCYGGN